MLAEWGWGGPHFLPHDFHDEQRYTKTTGDANVCFSLKFTSAFRDGGSIAKVDVGSSNLLSRSKVTPT